MSGTKDKVVIITGASSGIGEAVALHLAERGAKVVLGARREDRLESLAARIRTRGGQVAHRATDVTRPGDLTTLVDLARTHFGRVDVLINNAGVMPISAVDDLRVADWMSMIDVNIKGVLFGIAAVLPVFREQRSGHMINTASTAALKVVPNMSVYAGTKMAVRAISEGLRQEAGPDLRVTLVTPGMTLTEGATAVPSARIRAGLEDSMATIAVPPSAIARAMAFAIEQPHEIEVGEIVVRPTAQG